MGAPSPELKISRIPGSIGAIALACIAGSLGAQEFEIVTDYQVTEWRRSIKDGKTTERARHYRFESVCRISGGHFVIRRDHPLNAVEISHFDGTQVYTTIEPKPNPPPMPKGALGAQHPQATGGPVPVKVIPGRHPLGDLGLNLPWIAYCAFADAIPLPREDNLPLPVVAVLHSPIAFGCIPRVEWLADSARSIQGE